MFNTVTSQILVMVYECMLSEAEPIRSYLLFVWCMLDYIVYKSLLMLYSRLSLYSGSEVRPPRYTGHLVWHGLLARCLLHKTRPEPLDIPYTGHYWLPQTRFSMYVYYSQI